MARGLGRSKSLRILKGGHKETHQQETDGSAPQYTGAHVNAGRLKAFTPVSKNDHGRVETPGTLQRPTTSGGPGDRGKLFHKKTAPVEMTSPEDQAFVSPFPSPTKSTSTSVLYTAEVTEDREGIIGIALGSPTMAAPWATTPDATDYASNAPGTVTHISSNNPSHHTLPQGVENKQEAPKPKLSRLKSLFKKIPQPPRQEKTSFYQLAQSVVPARADSHHDRDSLDSRTQQEQEENVLAASPPAFKPEIRQSRRVPKGIVQSPIETRPRALTTGTNRSSSARPVLGRSASSSQPSPKDGYANSPDLPQLVVSDGMSNGSPRTDGEKTLLDINIPDVKMERYSVMFGSLLQSNTGRSSSLLSRRQGNSERLKPLSELSTKYEDDDSPTGFAKPQRRATSPGHAPKSPSGHLSLFPSANPGRVPSPRSTSVNRSRPQRSKTAPTPSPHRQSFPMPLEPDGQELVRDSKLPKIQTPTDTPTSSSSGTVDSETESTPIIVGRTVPRIMDNEPEWEIVTKPSKIKSAPGQAITKLSALSSHPSSAPMNLPSRADEMKSPQAQLSPAPRSADMTETNSNDDSQPTVGIARSVSVSRASPKPDLLRPTLVRQTTGRSQSSERMAMMDSRALTPTLVELKNRRSQRVQLVDV